MTPEKEKCVIDYMDSTTRELWKMFNFEMWEFLDSPEKLFCLFGKNFSLRKTLVEK